MFTLLYENYLLSKPFYYTNISPTFQFAFCFYVHIFFLGHFQAEDGGASLFRDLSVRIFSTGLCKNLVLRGSVN